MCSVCWMVKGLEADYIRLPETSRTIKECRIHVNLECYRWAHYLLNFSKEIVG